MPFQTTSLLPLTVSVSSVPDSLSPPTSEPLHPRPDDQHHHDTDRLPIAPASAGSDAPSATSSASKSSPPPPSSRAINHARRYTLSRFPLLRKGSRELSRTPSTTKSPAESPFYATGAPRSSQSLARGPDLSPAREPASPYDDGDVIAEEAENTHRLPDRPRAGKPDKMHQTSSRLLRMTDDERPFTRVSTTIQQLFEAHNFVTSVTSHGAGVSSRFYSYETTATTWGKAWEVGHSNHYDPLPEANQRVKEPPF
ncbi:hypothetical protein BKA58DRAFT_380672 [Alternaria rosae]|uniref:uncharacterized protein n=1 Tax=Alternaria rosae TaxID=1187941 RepID=UPI001E8E3A5E|nr:uncharacterized protein BKA58DRAFT_380672 [Alternaria rosae]KAH6875899.1 hypothetical protein BKA58DRAFT_380672 [Alternaria rosae]